MIKHSNQAGDSPDISAISCRMTNVRGIELYLLDSNKGLAASPVSRTHSGSLLELIMISSARNLGSKNRIPSHDAGRDGYSYRLISNDKKLSVRLIETIPYLRMILLV